MAKTYAFDLFLSYSSRDKDRVLRLARRLREAGLKVWLDDWQIKPGDHIFLKVEEGQTNARVLVLCMTENTFGSDWVQMERSTVMFRDPINRERQFLPLLLADCEIPENIKGYAYIDYQQETDDAFQKLLKACQPEEKEKKTEQAKETPKPIATLENKQKGHKGWVNSVAVSPDSRWVVSGSGDNTVRIWDMESCNCKKTLKGHMGEVKGVAITPDGMRILSGSKDESIRIWNAANGKLLGLLTGHTHFVLSVVALLDNHLALSCATGNDSTLKLWHINSRLCLKTFKGHTDAVTSVAVTRDGKRAVSGSYDKTVKYWDMETCECLHTLKGHTNSVKSVHFTPDEKYVVSGSDDKTIKLWNLETGARVGNFEGHQGSINSVAVSPGGNWVASAGFNDFTVRIWDLKTGNCVQVIEDKDGFFAPISVAFSPDGKRLVVGNAVPIVDKDYSLFIYRLTSEEAALPIDPGQRYSNAKVVLMGESGVGKSGLAHRLMEDKFVKTYSTHGMQVWRMDLPLPQEENIEREVLLWDLAGQEDYRLIHQLFLDETALALMLFNPQHEDPFREVVEWCKVLQVVSCKMTQGRQLAKLLIAARTDVGHIKISQKKIDSFLQQYQFAAYLPTSAYTGENCSDGLSLTNNSALKELIANHIPWHTLPWSSTPKLLKQLKDALLQMSEEHDVCLLRFPELSQRLKQHLPEFPFDEPTLRTAVTLLGNHGLVLELTFGDLVLLTPETINDYASAVIRAARAHIDEIGCVSEQVVFQLTFDLTGVLRLTPADEELLMRAMVQLLLAKSLCIAEETPAGKQLIFPSQYRRERPLPHSPEIFVSYSFCGELATIYTTLVVRLWYSREFDNKELWKDAAEFQTPTGSTTGLILTRNGEGLATIAVFFDSQVTDDLKVVFIQYIHQHLEKYATQVTRDRRYLCPNCATPVDNKEIIRKRLAVGKDFITCQVCDKKVPLIDIIERRLGSDPVAKRVLDMEQKATSGLDSQALEQILIGHMMAICGEANQIFRPTVMFDYGIDGEVEFKDNHGKASGKKIYVQLKNGASFLRYRQKDNKWIYDVQNQRHLEYWVNQPVNVFLVIRDEEKVIRWMNVSQYLRTRADKASKQIVFNGTKLDAPALWYLRDDYFPRTHFSLPHQ